MDAPYVKINKTVYILHILIFCIFCMYSIIIYMKVF